MLSFEEFKAIFFGGNELEEEEPLSVAAAQQWTLLFSIAQQLKTL